MKKLKSLLLFVMMMSFSLAGCLEENSADDTSVVEPIYTEYSFTGQDSDPVITSSNDDELIELTRTEDTGDDLNWAILVVKISIDAGAWITCDHDQPSGDGCFFTKIESSADNKWQLSEKISIAEDSANLCESPCDVEVELRNGVDDSWILDGMVVYAN